MRQIEIDQIDIAGASTIVSLSDGATISLDWSSGVCFDVTMAGNRTLGNPTNVVAGTTRLVLLKGNDSTDRTLTFGSNYKGDLPTLTDIDSGQYYLLSLWAYTTTHIVVANIEAL